jgi:hypothetical protein
MSSFIKAITQVKFYPHPMPREFVAMTREDKFFNMDALKQPELKARS